MKRLNDDRLDECPPKSDLSLFCAGLLPDDRIERVVLHADKCLSCVDWIEDHLVDDSMALYFRRDQSPPADGRLDKFRASPLAATSRTVPAAEPLVEGRRIRNWRITRRLGRGGMGEVFQAIDETLDCPVAIKILRSSKHNDIQYVERFKREIRATGQLDHRHIVRARAAGEDADVLFLVMDYVDGIDLKQVIAAGKPIESKLACELVRQAALGLQYIHDKGLVHRDVKPSNMMLGKDGIVRILDLGLAQLRVEEETDHGDLTASGAILGTADYMAPEQGANPRAADIRADIYSLGCSLFELLTGRTPFAGPEYAKVREKLGAHHAAQPAVISSLRSDVPREVSAIVMRMLAKEPGDRYQLPGDVAAALAPWSDAATIGALTVAPGVQSRRIVTRRRMIAAIGVAVASAAAAVAAWPRPWHERTQVLQYPGYRGQCICGWNTDQSVYTLLPQGSCLVSAGSVATPDFSLKVTLRQPQWSGGCGIFCGYHEVEREGNRFARFQLIYLMEFSASQMQIIRHLATIDPYSDAMIPVLTDSTGKPLLARTELITRPRDATSHVLEIGVRDGVMRLAKWDGADLPKLTSESANRDYPSSQYVNNWGFYAAQTTFIKDCAFST